MSLTYQTGTVIGSAALLSAAVTFLTTNCGATVVDTLSTNDKVLKLTGTDGRQKFLRLTITSDVGNPVKYGKERWRDGLISRLYTSWDAVAHTGTMRTGRFGPFLGVSSSSNPLNILRLPDNDVYPSLSAGYFNAATLTGRIGGLIGTRIIYSVSASVITFTDITTGESWAAAACPDGAITANQHAYVVTPDGKEHLYVIGANSAHLYRYDIDTNTWTQLADAPWAAAASGGFCVFDGNDTLYAARGSATTSFAKYTISTNTWTALTALPVARSSSYTNQTMAAYVPASASGLANDQIIFAANINVTTLHRYDVTAGTFTTITTPVNVGTNNGYIESFAFDDSKFIHFAVNLTASAYVLDVTTLAAPSVIASPYVVTSLSGPTGIEVFRQLTGIVFCDPSANYTYHLLGNTESLTIATVENGRSHWSYAGVYDSFKGGALMTTTGTVAAGFQASIPVNSSSGFTVGETLDFANADGTNWELVTISSIPDGTHIVANTTKSHATGAFIGRDLLGVTVTGSSGLASTPRDGQGYQTDYVSASWHCRPAFGSQQLNNTAPGGDKYFQEIPLLISGPPLGLANTNLTLGAGSMNANLGTLQNVYAFGVSGSAPPATGQTVIGTDGKSYIALRPNSEYPYSSGTAGNHGVVIGPIN